MNNKKDYRINESGHLDIEGYFHFAGITENYGDELKGKNMLILLTIRDIGKTTSCWSYLKNKYWPMSDFLKKAAYLRNNSVAMKRYIKSFNNNNKDYYMTDESIFKVSMDMNKKIIDKREVGMCVPLSCYENAKSTITEQIEFCLWDEFNEEDEKKPTWQQAKANHQLFKSLIDTIKTLERHRENFTLVLLGNKVSAENDILLNFDVESEDDDEDKLIERDIMIDDELIKIRFVIVGNNTFKHLKGHKTLANAIASFNKDTDRYLNKGGFLQKRDPDVISFRRISDAAIPKYYFIYDEFYFEFGKCANGKYYFHNIDKEDINYNFKVISLNLNGFINDFNSIIYDPDDYVDTFENFIKLIKNKEMYFTTNFAKAAMRQILNEYIVMEDL